ncbi:MAG: acyloxyacyl hydrolase [Balneolaceae bacterium]|nr:acyloxyacyl hydrolase [Balneolaceae bacterium]
MRYFLTLTFLMLAFNSHAQTLEIGYAPVSVEAGWGNLPKTPKFEVSLLFDVTQSGSFHYTPGLRYTHVNSTSSVTVDEFGDPVEGQFNMIFLLPAAFNISFNRFAVVTRMGIGLSDESFPNSNGLRTNFVLETGLKYTILDPFSLSVRYSHISNGYRGLTNPGVDNIVLSTEIQF